MSDMQIISNEPTVSDAVNRLIAEATRRAGMDSVSAYSLAGKKVTKAEYLAMMLWDAVIEGYILFADGSRLDIADADNKKLWLDVVKFLAGHLDGPVPTNMQFNNVNVFKVYSGIDTDKV